MQRIILNMIASEKRGAVLQGEKVNEWLFEQEDELTRSGNIILGKVTDIVPGMEAAFVDIGGDKNGFLHRNELMEYQRKMNEEDERTVQPSLNSLLTKGQSIIVQIVKEASGMKGARLTEVCSIPGKFIVYLPYGNYVAVSKKMKLDQSRDNWRKRGKTWLSNEEGIIIRTVAEQMDEEIIFAELERLRAQYKDMLKKAEQASNPPVLLFNQSSLIERVYRDFFSDGESEIVLDNQEEYKDILKLSGTEARTRIKLYQEKENIFSAYNLDKELEKSLRRHVWLKNGGFLVIDRTEALTVVDVNTGKYIGKESLRDTVVKTNIEAAHGVAEQLRLRDIGGIILIDFIDMKHEEDRKQVLTTLKKAVAKDRSLTNIAGYTQFGLVEMTRKKNRKSLDQLLLSPCPSCRGTGRVRNITSVVSELEREVYALRFTDDEAMLIDVIPTLLDELLKNNKAKLLNIEDFVGKKLYLLPNETLDLGERLHAIRIIGNVEKLKKTWVSRSSKT